MLTLVPVVVLFYVAFTELERLRRRRVDRRRTTSSGCWHDDSFWTALRNTVYYTAFHIPLTLVAVARPGAAAQPQAARRARSSAPPRSSRTSPRSWRSPYVWNLLFSPEYGPINQLLRALGVDHPPGWTVSADWSMPAVIIVGTWRDMGYYMLLFLAGLQTIPAQLYEAARVDGASAWQRFWHVTLPGAAAHHLLRHWSC